MCDTFHLPSRTLRIQGHSAFCVLLSLSPSLWKGWSWLSFGPLLPFWNSGSELSGILILFFEDKPEIKINLWKTIQSFEKHYWTKQTLTWATSHLQFVALALNPSLLPHVTFPCSYFLKGLPMVLLKSSSGWGACFCSSLYPQPLATMPGTL